MEKRKIGDLIDSFGVLVRTDDGDMITDVVVIAKVVQADGSVAVAVASGETTSWLDQLGLIGAAMQIERSNPIMRDED